eukprot:TRINITY_DN1220_c0_g1_i2.p1 TRINITY_DN1220_c0_g1~~TRINITY_DN1220_c0_g1_i2.p1  ORF type:complete len:143 (+),score=22.26 TRINITY_DN1220_c0_g1_i2:338-766(+)
MRDNLPVPSRWTNRLRSGPSWTVLFREQNPQNQTRIVSSVKRAKAKKKHENTARWEGKLANKVLPYEKRRERRERLTRGMSIGEVLGDTSGDICRASRLDSSPSMEGVGVRAGVETGLRSRTGVPRTSASSSTSMSIATIWR